jgi:AcrR family transcriptional regulator
MSNLPFGRRTVTTRNLLSDQTLGQEARIRIGLPLGNSNAPPRADVAEPATGVVAESTVERAGRGADTRRRIIEAAWSIIAERGISALTTRLVAQRAGVSHGMCNYHFAGKEDLVIAVVDYARHYWITPLEEHLAAPLPAREKLERIIDWMAKPATREVMRVHTQLLSQAEWNDELRERMAVEYGRWQALYVRLFRELAEDGPLVPALDPVKLGVAFATMADGLVWQQSLDPTLDTEPFMRAFVDVVLAETPHLDRAFGQA